MRTFPKQNGREPTLNFKIFFLFSASLWVTIPCLTMAEIPSGRSPAVLSPVVVDSAGTENAHGGALSVKQRLLGLIQKELSASYARAKVVLDAQSMSCTFNDIAGKTGALVLEDVKRPAVKVAMDSGVGNAKLFVTEGALQLGECWINYQALQSAWIPKRRILPLERVTAADLEQKQIDVSRGLYRETRGLFADAQMSSGSFDARQTLLEGQPILTNMIQKTPDLRRGDHVVIRMKSGDVEVTTPGVSDESGYLDQVVRVTTTKTKRTLSGRLLSDGVVEVRL